MKGEKDREELWTTRSTNTDHLSRFDILSAISPLIYFICIMNMLRAKTVVRTYRPFQWQTIWVVGDNEAVQLVVSRFSQKLKVLTCLTSH
jgi:hypothetical protein